MYAVYMENKTRSEVVAEHSLMYNFNPIQLAKGTIRLSIRIWRLK